MLTDRKELLKQARLAVHEEGYQYSKKRSRSKQFGSESGETEGSSVKRVKVTKDVRRARIDQLKEQLKTTNTHILFKEERIRAGAEKKNFKLCDLLTEEVEELQQKRREFEIELHALNKKDNRAKRYELKKHMIQRKEKDVQSSSDSEALFTPVSTGHSGLSLLNLHQNSLSLLSHVPPGSHLVSQLAFPDVLQALVMVPKVQGKVPRTSPL